MLCQYELFHYIVAAVYRKKTDIFLNWKSFGPNELKWDTLRTIITRAFEICSTNKFLEEEIEYIRAVFFYHNSYPRQVTDKIINKVKKKSKVAAVDNDESGDIKHQLALLYKGDKGIDILRLVEKFVRKLLPKKSTLQIAHTGKKLSSQLNIKDKTNSKHQQDLIYHVKCPIPTF